MISLPALLPAAGIKLKEFIEKQKKVPKLTNLALQEEKHINDPTRLLS